ncbi:MAG: hypothetical protein Q7S41_02680 [Candidatus Limnocylindria bacterium]|nr:hypothetical protein [Candidatus Limnocylindria bacterium]
MRALLGAGLALTLVFGATPSIARADDGEDTDVTDVTNDDPGIAALHAAIQDLRDANMALKAECPDMHDAKCRAAFKEARSAFKEARQAAIETHHAFKQEQKKAREEAKQKAKGARLAAKPSQSPKAPKPSASPHS